MHVWLHVCTGRKGEGGSLGHRLTEGDIGGWGGDRERSSNIAQQAGATGRGTLGGYEGRDRQTKRGG